MSSYVTNVNTTAGGSVYVDIGTLFCDNSHDQTLGGNKTFSGTVYVPTPATDASRTEVVTAAWIRSNTYAPINSPTFTGTPNAPTPATDASRTELVTAKWVNDKGYAPLDSPTFTGTPNGPTPTLGSSSTELITADWFLQSTYRTTKISYTNWAKDSIMSHDIGYGLFFISLRANNAAGNPVSDGNGMLMYYICVPADAHGQGMLHTVWQGDGASFQPYNITTGTVITINNRGGYTSAIVCYTKIS